MHLCVTNLWSHAREPLECSEGETVRFNQTQKVLGGITRYNSNLAFSHCKV